MMGWEDGGVEILPTGGGGVIAVRCRSRDYYQRIRHTQSRQGQGTRPASAQIPPRNQTRCHFATPPLCHNCTFATSTVTTPRS
jgi:hypothetical protein